MKTTTMITYVMLVIALGLIIACSSDCNNQKEDYKKGYLHAGLMGAFGNYKHVSCEDWVKAFNQSSENEKVEPTRCYCEGYMDAMEGKATQY